MPVLRVSKEPVTYDGVTRTLREWCQLYNLNYLTVRMRYIRGERDTTKLFKATPVPKSPIDRSKYAPKHRHLTDNTPPLWMDNLHIDVRRALLSHIDFDWDKLDALVQRLCHEYVEDHVLFRRIEMSPTETSEPTDILEGLDIELQ
jgi:hypothetical protein